MRLQEIWGPAGSVEPVAEFLPVTMWSRQGRPAQSVVRLSAGVTGLCGVLFLAAWILGWDAMTHIGSPHPRVTPATALCFVLTAGSLWMVGGEPGVGGRLWLGRLTGLAVLAAGIVMVSEYLFGLDVHADAYLKSLLRRGTEAEAGRTSHYSSVSFTLLGAALVLVDWRNRRGQRPAQMLALVAILMAALALVGHVIGYPPFYKTSHEKGMAVETAILVILAGVGILCARPGGLIEILSSGDEVGVTARRLLPLPLVLTFLLFGLTLAGVKAGLYRVEVGMWLLQFSTIVTFTGLIWLNADMLYRAGIERRRTRDTLAESERRFRKVFEAAPVGIALLDRSGRFLRVNPALCQMTGYGEEELGQMTAESLIHPEDQHRDGCLRERLFQEAAEKLRTERQIIKKDGGSAWMQLTVAEVDDAGEGARHVLALFEDMTERRLTTLQLKQRTEDLEKANREMEAFSYSVSHDLRAPLRAINGFSQILVEESAGVLSGKPLEYLRRVREGSERMGRLIDDMLAFSRLGRRTLSRTRVDVAEIVKEVLEELSPERQNRCVEVSIGELGVCRADAAMLKQVYANLLSNALKFTRRKETARIEIGARQEGDGTVYFVKDNGEGFDMRYADKLFGVFQRLHRETDFEGTGVGLAIVQRVVHHHGGSIRAEAEPGKGAAFFFTLGPAG